MRDPQPAGPRPGSRRRTPTTERTRRLHVRCSSALARSAERAEDDGARARRLAAAADHARRAGLPRRATALHALSLRRKAVSAARGQTELTRGLQSLRAGEVINAREALHLAAALYRHADRPDDELTALLHAAEASWTAGDGAGYAGAALRIGGHGAAPEAVRAYFRGIAAALRCDHARSVPALRAASLRGAAAAESHPAVPVLACRAALMLGDVSHARDLAGRALARAAGPQRTVPELLGLLALVELVADNHARAGAHAERGLEAAVAAGRHNTAAQLRGTLAMAAAVRGDAAACRDHARRALGTAQAHGLMVPAVLATWSLGLLDLAQQRPRAAVELLRPLVLGESGVHHFAWRVRVIPSFVEAVALAVAGLPAPARKRACRQARLILRTLEEWAEATGDQPARATVLHCRAVLAVTAAPACADPCFGRALALVERVGSEFAQARTKLAFGMALRRLRRPGDARAHLRGAMLLFEACGAEVWAERARDEMRAAGQAEPGGRPRPAASLTPQQLRVARHVAEGRTNREVAALLAVSHRTVDHHLRNVFAALGIRSRVELVHALTAQQP
ncbi:helix-turn-helix transcriptional regulator [Streptomyces roseoverticillatus]|uniref:helix-turn-helix transcriptional regulator n=1 Tax=Streptomyces roseoverticillatus TaxID=66429 RepID=UPI001F40EBCE|nr:helix-turn-helix transcriptional regulator [Streptomyces roseoverticillatus]MCF3101285.1 helix-turn-helix transcriptional regulator [Streptomyces roseoverticillatus]